MKIGQFCLAGLPALVRLGLRTEGEEDKESQGALWPLVIAFPKDPYLLHQVIRTFSLTHASTSMQSSQGRVILMYGVKIDFHLCQCSLTCAEFWNYGLVCQNL